MSRENLRVLRGSSGALSKSLDSSLASLLETRAIAPLQRRLHRSSSYLCITNSVGNTLCQLLFRFHSIIRLRCAQARPTITARCKRSAVWCNQDHASARWAPESPQHVWRRTTHTTAAELPTVAEPFVANTGGFCKNLLIHIRDRDLLTCCHRTQSPDLDHARAASRSAQRIGQTTVVCPARGQQELNPASSIFCANLERVALKDAKEAPKLL
mmetsp:Transcript_107254/g.268861  ORF Transcript_107254/g.268861 Transcript_107254/m.268861 type:complete len:213 (-) Transcript_107254:1330-1968(-)